MYLCALLFSGLLALMPALSAYDVVYLSWQSDPTTTMTVHWLSDSKMTDNSVEYKTSAAEEWQKKEATCRPLPKNVPHNIHVVELTNLTPDSLYTFKLPGETNERSFKTLPKTLKHPLRFAVGGDIYPRDVAPFQEMAQEAASKNPAFVLLGGDLAYSVSEKKNRNDDFVRWHTFLQTWTEVMKDASGCMIPVVAAIGNHEVVGFFGQTPEQAQFYYALFTFPGTQGYNALHFGDYMDLIVLDSNHTHPISGAQTEWLKQELSQSLHFAHCFAIYHVPAYPSVRYFRSSEACAIRKHWVPLFEKYHVSAVFENHDHAYKRTYPLVEGAPAENGVVYFGDGSWGTNPRIPKRAARTSYLAKTASKKQFILVELTEEKRTYTSITAHDHIIDTYEQHVGKPSPIP